MTSPSGIQQTDADRRVRALAEEEWTWRKAEFGSAISWIDDEVADRLPSVAPAAQEARAEHWRAFRAQLDEIPRSELSAVGRADLDVLAYQTRIGLDQIKHRQHEAPANSDSSPWNELIDGARRDYATLEQADAYLSLLDGIPQYLDEIIANMRAGIARGFGPTRVTMVGRDATARSVADDEPGNAFRRIFATLPARLGAEAVAERRAAAQRIVDDAIIPAYAKLADFLAEEYLPNLPEEVSSVARYGEEYYADQLYEFTTTTLTPQEIHERGLAAVAGILAEMREISHRLGHGDDLDGLFAFLRTDPQFYARTPQELLNEAAWQAKMFDGVVGKWFGVIPRSRFRIEEPPADLAPFYTFGRGGLGLYVLNTYPLDQRPLYSLMALTLHEAAPGHAFQVAHALENPGLADFRKKSYISAFGEGWALYTERLGVEMGMYRSDFELLGMLSFQMWRAVRMVIDPGLHALGWTREQAIAYLRDHTAIGEHEVVTEVDRYIAWPGQAPSYALGQALIEQLRHEAEQALGEDFSPADFHDAVLDLGSVPLEVLEREIRVWIDQRSAAKADAR
ncbi:DUF885 domain-containing protein [Microbacterium sp. NPDC057650]|uniref:DUF885 domain-containing protein n=1 Tax=unclassified Microbacterium TaxID=2609290 RepID=UPI003670F331